MRYPFEEIIEMESVNKIVDTLSQIRSNQFPSNVTDHWPLSLYDIYLFNEGRHFQLYNKLGAHLVTLNNVKGVYFAVWAPNAKKVSVIGNFNHWNKKANPLAPFYSSGSLARLYSRS